MAKKLAVYVGGSLDGMRKFVEELPREANFLRARRQDVYAYPVQDAAAPRLTGTEINTDEEWYRLGAPPFNPSLVARRSYDVDNVEIGVYFYVGKEPVYA